MTAAEKILGLLLVAPLLGAMGWSLYQLRVKAVHLRGDYRPLYVLGGIITLCFVTLAIVLALD